MGKRQVYYISPINWLFNIDSGTGLLPDDTRPLPVAMSPYRRWDPLACINIYLNTKYTRSQTYFREKMPSQMIIACLLKFKQIWDSAQINLSSTRNFYRKYFFEATISTEKSTSEIDADLAQNEM